LVTFESKSTGLSAEGMTSLLARTPYRPIRFLGRGGVGEVYVIEHEFLGRSFALKVLHPRHDGESTFADRMRVEAQVMGRLNHPNVVSVVDFWVASDGRPCVVMELLEGRTLNEELIERRRLPTVEALAIASQALTALGAAHALGVVHRDVKPENLFLHHAAGYGRVLKVLDFGIARVLPEGSSRTPARSAISTATGAFVGTPRFMSPEAARGERVDARADLFGLGLVLYVMLAGHSPFDAGSAEPEPPSRYAGTSVPPELDALVLRSLEEAPERRFQTAEAFLAAIKPFAGTLGPLPAPA